jgi:hypothetical protein
MLASEAQFESGGAYNRSDMDIGRSIPRDELFVEAWY